MNEKISTFLAERIAANDFPSAVYLVAEKGEIVYHEALGNAVVTPEVIPARLDTIYDLASLTKPLVTGLLCAQAVESKRLRLDEGAVRVLGKSNHELDGIAVSDLAAHISGLPDWLPFYLLSGAPKSVGYGVYGEAYDHAHEFVLGEILTLTRQSDSELRV